MKKTNKELLYKVKVQYLSFLKMKTFIYVTSTKHVAMISLMITIVRLQHTEKACKHLIYLPGNSMYTLPLLCVRQVLLQLCVHEMERSDGLIK